MIGRRVLLALPLALAAVVIAAAPAGAAQRLITIETPSVNVDPARTAFNGPPPKVLKANVLLPDGYESRRRWPVLFLLHGAGDSYDTWAKPANGDIRETARGLPAIVVMPEGGKGFYMNWFNGGVRGDPGWERYYLDELIPQVERRLHVAPGRRNHAIAGLSMGGFGASYLGGQRPGYFGSVFVFSGFVEPQRPEVKAAFQAVAGVDFETVFGPIDGPYASGHNPTKLAANLRSTPVYVAYGNGVAAPGVQSSPNAVTVGGLVEAEIAQENQEFVAALRDAGVAVAAHPMLGVHDWPYWRADLRAAIARGLFRDVPEAPSRWSYSTIADRGVMWGLRYRFAAPPPAVATFTRDGGALHGRGSGIVTLADTATGCAVRATLPFDAPVPSARCGRLAARVSPRAVRAGRRAVLRVHVTRAGLDGTPEPLAGAIVRLGHRQFGTDGAGRATIVHRFRPGAVRRSVRIADRRGHRVVVHVRIRRRR